VCIKYKYDHLHYTYTHTYTHSYEEAARRLAEGGSSASLAAVDATQANKLAKSLEVTGFPTFVYFEHGKMKFKLPNRAGLDANAWVKIMQDPWKFKPEDKEEL
jgi:thioredoxin-related protein